MAYDVNAAIAKPNLLATVQQGWAFGTQQRQIREEEQRQNELRTLTAPAVSGDMAAQDRMLALDPERAKQAMGVGQIRMSQLKGGMDYLRDAIQSGNPQRIAAAEAQVGPFMAKVAGKPWQPGALTADPAAFEQAYAKVAMMAGQAEGRDGKVVGNALVDPQTGRVIYQGPEVPVNAQIVEIADGRGGKVQAMFDPRTRQVMPLPAPGGGAPQGTPQAAPSPQPAMRTAGPLQPASVEEMIATIEREEGTTLPEEVKAQMRAEMAKGGTFNTANTVGAVAPGAGAPSGPTIADVPINELGGGGYGYIPPPAKAAPAGYTWEGDTLAPIPGGPADKGSQAVAQLSAAEVQALGLPEGTVAQRDEAGKVTTIFTPDAGTRKAARDAKAKLPRVDAALRRVDRLASAVDTIASGTFDGGPVDQYALRFTPEGQEVIQAAASLLPELTALTRVPGVGSQSDLETRLANLQLPSLEFPPEVNRRALGELRTFMGDLADVYRGMSGDEAEGNAPSAAPMEGAQQAPDGNWYVQQGNRWFKVER